MKASNVTWHHGEVSSEGRAELLGHRSACLWFTGLSGSGKSTLARRVEKQLVDRGVNAYVLDGDNVRHGLNGDLGFSPEERVENAGMEGTLPLTSLSPPPDDETSLHFLDDDIAEDNEGDDGEQRRHLETCKWYF